MSKALVTKTFLSFSVYVRHVSSRAWLVTWAVTWIRSFLLHWSAYFVLTHRPLWSLNKYVSAPDTSPLACSPCWGPKLWRRGSHVSSYSVRCDWTSRPRWRRWSQRKRICCLDPLAPQRLKKKKRNPYYPILLSFPAASKKSLLASKLMMRLFYLFSQYWMISFYIKT